MKVLTKAEAERLTKNSLRSDYMPTKSTATVFEGDNPIKEIGIIEPAIEIGLSEYKALIAKAEQLRLIENALKNTTLSKYEIERLFFGKEGE